MAAGEGGDALLVEKVVADGAADGGALHRADQLAQIGPREGAELGVGEDELRVAHEEEHGERRVFGAGAADRLDALKREEGGGVVSGADGVVERVRVVAGGVGGAGVDSGEDDAVLDAVKVGELTGAKGGEGLGEDGLELAGEARVVLVGFGDFAQDLRQVEEETGAGPGGGGCGGEGVVVEVGREVGRGSAGVAGSMARSISNWANSAD